MNENPFDQKQKGKLVALQSSIRTTMNIPTIDRHKFKRHLSSSKQRLNRGLQRIQNLPGIQNLPNLPEIPNLHNLPGIPNISNLPGIQNIQNLPGFVSRQHTKTYSKLNEIPKGKAGEHLIPGCLVLEGGAFRGLYTQGFLDAMMIHGINLSCVIGVSAGALGGMNYVSGQIGRSARINLTYRHDSRYVGMKAFLHSHSILDVGFLTEDRHIFEPLDMERFLRPQQRYVAVATDCETGKPMYFEKGKCEDIATAIRASGTMPYISPMVEVGGRNYLDGGCSCKIPYQWALDQNFEKIVVIKTRDVSYRRAEKRDERAHRLYPRHPAFAEVQANSNFEANRQLEEIEKLHAEGRIYRVAPSSPVKVSQIESDVEKLGELYWEGYHDCEKQLPSMLAYLGISEDELPLNGGVTLENPSEDLEEKITEPMDSEKNRENEDAVQKKSFMKERKPEMNTAQKILIVVDMQYDFISEALGTKEAQAIVENVCEKIRSHEGPIIVTRDTHFENYMETREGKLLPVTHCIKGTHGWQLHEDVEKALEGKEVTYVDKFSFGSTALPGIVSGLVGTSAFEIELVGVCTDICVVSNALILKAAFSEIEMYVDSRCCAGVTPEKHEAALETMRSCQIIVK